MVSYILIKYGCLIRRRVDGVKVSVTQDSGRNLSRIGACCILYSNSHTSLNVSSIHVIIIIIIMSMSMSTDLRDHDCWSVVSVIDDVSWLMVDD